MDKDKKTENEKEIKAPLTKEEKEVAHKERINRTVVACFMGVIAGILSYVVSGVVDPVTGIQPNAIVGWLILLGGIVIQKYIFLVLKIDFTKLTKKDWFYQSFMTFALWIISWTLLLSTNNPLL
jgi:hypothetical protein